MLDVVRRGDGYIASPIAFACPPKPPCLLSKKVWLKARDDNKVYYKNGGVNFIWFTKKQNNKKREDEIKKYQFMVMKYVTNAQKIEVITMQYARKVF